MDEAEKIQIVNTTGYTVLTLTGAVVASLAYRLTVRTYAKEKDLRRSFRFTRQSVATVLGAVLTVGMLGAVAAKGGGLFAGASSLFGWHPLAMVCATTVISPAALDAVAMRHNAKGAGPRKVCVSVHAALQAAAAATMALGLAAIYANKPSGKHFLSLHSWVGLAALGLCGLNLVYGILRSAHLPYPVLLWRDATHRMLGCAAMLLLCASTALGLYNKVLLLPEGWGGSLARPSVDWLAPGGTWAYAALPGGGKGVYVALALLFWVAYFALVPDRPSLKKDEGGTHRKQE